MAVILACLPAHDMSAWLSKPRRHPDRNSSSDNFVVLFVDEIFDFTVVANFVIDSE